MTTAASVFAMRRRPSVGLRPTERFLLVGLMTAAYVGFAVWVSAPWRDDIEQALGPVMAWVIPLSIAYVPGLVIGFFMFTVLLTRYRPLELVPPDGEWPPVTVLIAAWNEEHAIERTVECLAALRYPGPIEVVLADNNSTDRTAALAAATAARHGLHYRRVLEPSAGKHFALNTALATVTTPIVVTVDADTFAMPDSVTYLVVRLAARPQDQHVAACAGALIVENPLASRITRMQAWDYRLGINGVKRMQAAYNSALVAQGAFSAYWTDDVRGAGGWPDAIGEDIVLTWTLMSDYGLIQYEPRAMCTTVVPERVKVFMSQRSRWARGMFEGLKSRPPHHQPRVLAKIVASIDYLVPVLDFGYVFFWLPGVVLFVFGYPLIFSWWSMLLLPVTVVLYGLLRRWQDRNVFRQLDIHPAANRRGFFGYLLGYQAFSSVASLRGYWQFAVGSARHWR